MTKFFPTETQGRLQFPGMMLVPSRFGVLFAWSLALGLAGCAVVSDDDDAESQDQETKVKPKGNETFTTGTVVVKAPAGAPELEPVTLWLSSPAQKVSGHLDEPLTAPIGTYDLLVSKASNVNAFISIGKVDVKGGQTLTMTVPVLAPIERKDGQAPADLTPVTLDYGPTVTPWAPKAWQQLPALAPRELTYANPIGTNLGVVLVPGSKYRVERPKPDGTMDVLATLDVPAGPGKVHKLGAVSAPWAARTMQVPSGDLELQIGGSEFPSSFGVQVLWSCESFTTTTQNFQHSAGQNQGKTIVAAGVAPTKTITGKFLADGKCEYRVVGVEQQAIDETQAKTTVRIEYIDVDDVVITHTDGTKRTVKGTFTLSKVPGPGQNPYDLVTARPTGTAVPVFPGTYVVRVSYNDNVGAKSYTENVSIP